MGQSMLSSGMVDSTVALTDGSPTLTELFFLSLMFRHDWLPDGVGFAVGWTKIVNQLAAIEFVSQKRAIMGAI